MQDIIKDRLWDNTALADAVIFLSQGDLERIDPTGRGARKILTFRRGEFRNPSDPNCKPGFTMDNLLKKVVNGSSCGAHKTYYEFNLSYLPKVGRQGGQYSFATYLDKIKAYYADPRPSDTYNPSLILVGRDLLMREIQDQLDKFGYPQFNKLWRKDGTSSGLPVMLRKGDYFAEVLVSKLPYEFTHGGISIAGERVLKTKERLIQIQANENVRYAESSVRTLTNWLKEHLPYFDAWKHPDEGLRPNITKFLDKSAINAETDFESMDINLKHQLVIDVVVPIIKLLVPAGESLHLIKSIDNCFTCPEFLGDSIRIGLHTLFSGDIWTNFVETIIDICAVKGVLAVTHVPRNKYYVAAIGDDILLLLLLPMELATKINDMLVSEFEHCDLKMNRDKCRFNTGNAQFCKKVYYTKGVRNELGYILGSYPSVLAFNSILNPEHSCKTNGQAAVRILQILDNCYGSPDFTPLCQFVSKYTTYNYSSFTETDVDYVNIRDWWFQVYGESWNPNSSLAFKVISKQ